jgi:Ca2+-binding RTX toxin-like protein
VSFTNVKGTPGADHLTGTPRADLLDGDGGSDVIRGLGGADWVTTALQADDHCLQPGSLARLYGGDGQDRVVNTGACRSRLSGGSGADRIGGHLGDDHMLGNSGDDELISGRGADRLRGGSGDDRIEVERGTILVSGGGGFDSWINWRQVSQNTHHTVVDIGAGTFTDRVVDRDGTDFVTTGRIFGIEHFRGRVSQERFVGSSGVDRINAGGTRGDQVDTIRGLGGADQLIAPRHGRIDGGAGRDHCRAETVVHCEA